MSVEIFLIWVEALAFLSLFLSYIYSMKALLGQQFKIAQFISLHIFPVLVSVYKFFLLSWTLPENVNPAAHPITFLWFPDPLLFSPVLLDFVHNPAGRLQRRWNAVAGLQGRSRDLIGCVWQAFQEHRWADALLLRVSCRGLAKVCQATVVWENPSVHGAAEPESTPGMKWKEIALPGSDRAPLLPPPCPAKLCLWQLKIQAALYEDAKHTAWLVDFNFYSFSPSLLLCLLSSPSCFLLCHLSFLHSASNEEQSWCVSPFYWNVALAVSSAWNPRSSLCLVNSCTPCQPEPFLLPLPKSAVPVNSSLRTVLCAQSLESCLALWDPRDCSPPGSSTHGIFQARILERVATLFSRASSQLRDQTHISCVSCIGRKILYHRAIWEAHFILLILII